MNALFINISNHPSDKWSPKQIEAALDIIKNGPIIDAPFPQINPELSSEDVIEMADTFANTLFDLIEEYEPDADYVVFHIMGEMNFTYNLVKNFKEEGYHCYASTTKRNVVEDENGVKTSVFEFVQFREY